MKEGKINVNGELYIKRGDAWIKQICHRMAPTRQGSNTDVFFCNHNCPLFKDPVRSLHDYGTHGALVTLCERAHLFKTFTDERT